MNQDLLRIIDSICRDKNIDRVARYPVLVGLLVPLGPADFNEYIIALAVELRVFGGLPLSLGPGLSSVCTTSSLPARCWPHLREFAYQERHAPRCELPQRLGGIGQRSDSVVFPVYDSLLEEVLDSPLTLTDQVSPQLQ